VADGGHKVPRMTDAEREEALAKLVQRTTKLTDDEVVLLRAAWPTVVRTHFPAVRRQVKRRIPDVAVKDVLQDINALLFRALKEGFPKKSFRAFVGTIAKRRIVNWLRDHAHEAESVALTSSSVEKPRSSAPGVDSIVGRRELRERGEEIRSMLSPEQQEVFDLVFVGDASLTEAAEELGLPVGTFKSRLLATKRAIKVAWEELMRRRKPE
jgi:RNA polymerase sigma factor (sigma-70 family)